VSNANLPNGLLPQELAALPRKCLITGAAIPAALRQWKVTDQALQHVKDVVRMVTHCMI
jgi:hypothetical protein